MAEPPRTESADKDLEREVEHAREIADKGESEWTPAIVGGGVLLILMPIVAFVIGIALAVYYWA